MIVLLSCSIYLYGNDYIHSSTGEVDSVKIAYSDLRIVNSKLIELNYTKEINTKLKTIIANDSVIINSYKNINTNLFTDNKKYKKQRNVSFIATAVAIVGLVVSLIK